MVMMCFCHLTCNGIAVLVGFRERGVLSPAQLVGLLGGGEGSSVISGPRSVRSFFFWVRSFVSLPGGLADWGGMVQFTYPSDPFKGGLGTRCLFMLLSWYEA